MAGEPGLSGWLWALYFVTTGLGAWPPAWTLARWQVRDISSFEGARGFAGVAYTLTNALVLIAVLWLAMIVLRRWPAAVVGLCVVFALPALLTLGEVLSLLR